MFLYSCHRRLCRLLSFWWIRKSQRAMMTDFLASRCFGLWKAGSIPQGRHYREGTGGPTNPLPPTPFLGLMETKTSWWKNIIYWTEWRDFIHRVSTVVVVVVRTSTKLKWSRWKWAALCSSSVRQQKQTSSSLYVVLWNYQGKSDVRSASIPHCLSLKNLSEKSLLDWLTRF